MTYYDTLGVARNASETDIRKAYKSLAMKYHPDRNVSDNPEEGKRKEAKFKEVQKAYAILSNPQKRASYDQFGEAGIDPSMAGGGAGAGGFSDIGDAFGDIFSSFFGGDARQSRKQQGADLLYNLTLNLEDAIFGKETTVQIPNWVQCKDCSGSGAKKDSSPVTCNTCDGSGRIQIRQGFIALQQTCPECQGAGQTIKDPCHSCQGQGRIRKQETLSIKIPAGVDTGDRIRLHGKGEAGQYGSPAGDLYIEVNIKEHPIFTREHNDLHCEAPINFTSAILGGEIDIPTLDGQVKLKIPPGTQSGKLFRLRAKGVKSVRSNRLGDLFCKIIVETPVNLDKEQKALLQQLHESLAKDSMKHSPRSLNWLQQMKQFFKR